MDFRKYLADLDRLGELSRIDGADADLEIGVITELSDERNGKALLFDNIKGYPSGYRVAANMLASPRRMAATLGLPLEASSVELVYGIKEKFKSITHLPPVEVTDGPVLENVLEGNDADLLRFPAPKWHEEDGGRYIGTGDMVIMRDPKGGWVNAGAYRVQLHDRNTLGLYISPGHHGRFIRESYWAQNQSCPVAVVLGAHPLLWMPSCMGLAWGTSELDAIGGLFGEALPVVRGSHTGLPVPAYAEIAVEGECPPPGVESRLEGPFGEWPGYYASGARNEPVIKVKRLMYRNSPVILGVPPIKPPGSGSASYLLRAANVWRELEGLGIPGIRGVWNLRAGGSRYLAVVSVEQKYAGHAKQAGMAAMSGPEGAFQGRFVIVVDDDIDPSNVEDVMWAVATRCDPATSIEIVKNYWATPLDPVVPPEKRASGDLTGSRAIVLACRPFHWRKDFPRVNRASDELRRHTLKRWPFLTTEGTPVSSGTPLRAFEHSG